MIDPLIGRLVGGRYKIVRPLAAGGMGAVYDAVQESLQREVALKVIRAGNVDERFRLRFEAEALVTSRLKDPHVVTVHDFGIDDDLPYLVLEKLEGRDLSTELGTRGRMSWPRAVRVLRGIAAALAAAARVGVVHRDLKPSNIFLVDNPAHPDFVKVLDFGIAKLLVSEGPRKDTDAGSVVGTPGYVAPERLLGEPDDPRSDLYALGVIAWELLAGRPPFEETGHMQLALLHLQEPAPRLSSVVDVPAALDALVSALLEKTAAARPSAVDVVAMLDALDLGTPAPGPLLHSGTPSDPLLLTPRSIVPTESSSRIALPVVSASSLTPSTKQVPSSSSSSSSIVAAAIVVVVVAGIGLALFGKRGPSTAEAAFHRLSWEPGVERDAAFAPDGSRLAYVAPGAGGLADLFVIGVNGEPAANLSNTPRVIESDPAFSADGQQLAWVVHDDDGDAIWLGGPRGERARRLIDAATTPAFSADGRELFFGSVGFDEPEAVSVGRAAEIRSLDLASGKVRVVADALASFEPAVSARARVAFWAIDERGHRDIWTVTRGGVPVAVTRDAAVDHNPIWSDDGDTLHFLSDRSGTMSLWSVAIDDDGAASAPVPLLPGAVSMRSVSMAGKQIAYRSGTSSTSIERRAFDAANEDEAVGAPTLLLETARELKSIDVSPSGRWLVAEVLGQHSDLLLIDTETLTQRLLTDDAAFDRSPRFVDDARVAFASNRGGPYGIWLVDVDGTGLRALPAGPCPTVAPLPSPDGRRLAAFELDCGGRLAVYELASTEPPAQLQLSLGATLLPMAWRGPGTLVVNRLGTGYDVVDVGSGAVDAFKPRLVLGGFVAIDEQRLLALAERDLVVVDGSFSRAVLVKATGQPFVMPDDVVPAFALSADRQVLWTASRRDQSDLWIARLR
ncbi:MAG: protein kinase [Deltaproteobacteria bacterium]|nr:protein kinase [Deltaproteobacteria bacterium]